MKGLHERYLLLHQKAWDEDRTGRPVVCSQRASQSRFSRDCKNDIFEEEANHDRTERPVVCSERAHQFVIGDDETELGLSLGSRSFLHRVNDQVRKRQIAILNRCNRRQRQSDEIYGVKTIYCENSSWKYLSLTGDEEVSHL